MTATINASTTAGVVTTADTSGILQLQTNGTAALTIDASQNVGIGTASPGAKFSLTSTGSTTADGVRLTFGSEARAHNIYSALSTGRDLTIAPYRALTINTGSGTAEGVLGLNAYEYTTFGTGSSYTERMRIDSSGNVGIGTTTPAAKLVSAGSSATNFKALILRNGDGTVNSAASIDFEASTGTQGDEGTMAGRIAGIRTGSGTSGALAFSTTNAGVLGERARIHSSGNMSVGTTGDDVGRLYVRLNSTTLPVVQLQNEGASGQMMTFRTNGNSQVGSISFGISTVAYNTSSDYRLKEAIAPMTGALAKVALLKPVTYKWKVDGSDGQGFIAHELAEVEAGCVTGEKDAVDADGKPQYQGIDTSFLVATLTAAIQELKAIVDAQGAEIAALKGATA